MTAKTPGQAAYEHRIAAEGRRFPTRCFIAWDGLSPAERADEEAAAQAAIDAAQPVLRIAASRMTAENVAQFRKALADALSPHAIAAAELTATRAERDQARAELRRMQDAVRADLGQLLEALGLGDYARPESPHEVFLQCVARARELASPGSGSSGAAGADRPRGRLG